MRYQVKNLDTSSESEFRLETALKPLTFLPVPFVSQVGAGADSRQNDSGAASAVMLLCAYQPDSTLTPDTFSARFALPGDLHFNLAQIRAALAGLGVPTESRAGLGIQDVFAFLAASKPVLAALRYQTLTEAGLTESGPSGPHFVVVVGLDIRHVYIHDPSRSDPAEGAARAIPLDVFWRAWRETASEAQSPIPERSALIPTNALGFRLARRVRVNILSLNIRKGPALNTALAGTLRKDQTVEITRELNGWGEIPEVGWIMLSYTIAA
jgi:hypothetical protein